MKTIKAEIVADSISPKGHRITTMLLTFPRFILPELLTHRMFSRNSASSRAIPFDKMVKMVEEDPFIPIAWQKHHKGMQGTEYFTTEEDIKHLRNQWLDAVDAAAGNAEDLFCRGITKQLCNRLLEPFMWHQALVTSTEWQGFFELRCPQYEFNQKVSRSKKEVTKRYFQGEYGDPLPENDIEWLQINKSQAEIHIQALAECMWDAMNESTPKKLVSNEWHIPFGDKIYINHLFEDKSTGYAGDLDEIEEAKIKIATARCARLSYMNHEGETNYKKDIELHDRLLKDKHFSPFEHSARCMTEMEYYDHVKGEARVFSEHSFGWCRNFRGWIPYRYEVDEE